MGLLNSGSTLASVVAALVHFINLLVWVLGPLALVVFFWGLVRYIYKAGDAKAHEEARETIIWSLVAIFVMFSIWGILALLNVSFFGGTINTPGTITPSYTGGATPVPSAGTAGGTSGGFGSPVY